MFHKRISTALEFCPKTLEYKILDQRLLPWETSWVKIDELADWEKLLLGLGVRGAPLIGVSAALALAKWVARETPKSLSEIVELVDRLKLLRPTAVNLSGALDEMLAQARINLDATQLLNRALKIFEADVVACEAMAKAGTSLLNGPARVMTICNSGGLATAGLGTALGVIRQAFRDSKLLHVYPLETRPLLQGARLTAWELAREKIPHTLISDSMAASVLRDKKIDAVFVGADRIAANGDFANKIGTYSLAILCRYHEVPLYVVAPKSTLDLNCPSGFEIPIEQRSEREMRGCEYRGQFLEWVGEGSSVFNPAFDVTPFELVSAWVIEDKIFRIPNF